MFVTLLQNKLKNQHVAPSRNTRESETQQQDLRKNSSSAGIIKGTESKEKQEIQTLPRSMYF